MATVIRRSVRHHPPPSITSRARNVVIGLSRSDFHRQVAGSLNECKIQMMVVLIITCYNMFQQRLYSFVYRYDRFTQVVYLKATICNFWLMHTVIMQHYVDDPCFLTKCVKRKEAA